MCEVIGIEAVRAGRARTARGDEPLQEATIGRWLLGPTSDGIQLAVELLGDEGEEIGIASCRPGEPSWRAFWRAAGVEAPSDLDLTGDLGAALDELRGRQLKLRGLDIAAPVRVAVAA